MNSSIKGFFKPDIQVKVNGSLWLQTGGIHFFGPGPVELLERINETGSINAAAKQMKMSYKKAWELVNILNMQMKSPMVIPQIGGQKGGGSTLTAQAIQLIQYHREMRERFAAFLAGETELLNEDRHCEEERRSNP